MRNESTNPLFDHKFLGETSLYPARHVEILWNRGEHFRIRDVEVALAPIVALNDTAKSERYYAWRKKWASTMGNTSAEWMQPNGITPAEVFGVLLSCGFVDALEMKHAVREFSGIQECDWARDMLRGFPVEEDAPDQG